MHNYIIYNGIDSRTFGLYFELENISILPESRECVQEIPKLDGVIDYEIGGYGRRTIRATAVFVHSLSKLRKQRDAIEAWLSNNGSPKKLILGDRIDRYYKAKVVGALDFECKSDRHLGDIEFVCNPPWPYLADGTLLTPEQLQWVNCEAANNQFIKEFSGAGSIRFVNKGTMSIKPIIKLIGFIKSGIELTCGTQKLKLNLDNIYDGIAVDCNNETVTRLSDGENLSPYIDSEADAFFTIESGNAEIYLSMPELAAYPKSVTVIIEFQAMDGVNNE